MCPKLTVAQGTPTYLPDVTALTGGVAGCLDALPTAGLQLPHIFQTAIADMLQNWKLRAKASGDVVNGTTIIQPTDYDATINNVVLALLTEP